MVRIGRWSEAKSVIVFQEDILLRLEEMIVRSGEVGC